MLENFKKSWKNYISTPLSNLLRPITRTLAAWFEPVGQFLQPYKERFDGQWASFAIAYPRLSVWIRRGTKLAAALYACYFVFAIGLLGEIPSVDELKDMQTLNTSEVYTADSVVIGKFYKENRKDIQYEDIPQHTVDALVSTEDKRFWNHSGVDFRALGRVFWYSIVKGDEKSGGGSTLSQQLAKNIFGRQKYAFFSTPINKVREMLIARRLERAYDKKNLLAFYLNTVPFGGNVFGIEMAAQRFFHKTAKELKVEEGAVLIGMLQLNTKYNPRRNPIASLKRRNEVLDNMVENEKLDTKLCDKLKKDSIKLNYQVTLNRDYMASYFKDYLRTQMAKLLEPYKKDDGKPYDIYNDGLKIYTSIDSKMQIMAEEAVHERMSKLQSQFDSHWSGQKWWGDDKWLEDAMKNSDRWKKLALEGWNEKRIRQHFVSTKIPITLFAWENGKPSEDERTITPYDSIKYYFRQLNTGFMALDPKTGLVKAWVGGTDFNYYQYDHVKSRRQVGSTFKPIVYAKAIQAGVRPCDYVPNSLTAYMSDGTTKSGYDVTEDEKKSGKAWVPHNSDEDGYSGEYSLEGALTNSVNVVSAYLIHKIGYRPVQDLAKLMGVTSELQSDLSISLGTADISLFDMMKVYGTFATRGKRPEPISVLKVATRDGKVIADFTKDINPAKWQQVLTTDEADIMTRMMQSVVKEGTAERLRSTYDLNNDIAGKTGTTQSQSDGWFMGFTPNIVVGAWVGGITPAVHFRDIDLGQGAHMALPICGIFLKKLYGTPQYAAMKKDKFSEPAKWIKDSMDCVHRHYAEDENQEANPLNLLDSLNMLNPQPVFPEEKQDQREKFPEEDHSLSVDKNDGQQLPLPKPEVKTQSATNPLKPVQPQPKPQLPQPKQLPPRQQR
jgi:penicillin-binding protein 1A